MTKDTSSSDAEKALTNLLNGLNSELTLMKQTPSGTFNRMYEDSNGKVTEEGC